MGFTPEQILAAITQAKDIETLRALRDRIHEEILSYPPAAAPGDWNEWVNTLHDNLIRFAVRAAERELEDIGLGPPPKRYAMLLFGSGGRREQTLWSDQDNGLIYEDPGPGEKEAVAEYFYTFRQTVVKLLFRLGYPPCEGNVMCHNPLWGQSFTGWRSTLEGWMADPDWENVRHLLIVGDTRCISGDPALAAALGEILSERMRNDKKLLEAMLRNTLKRKVSLGVLGNLIPERFGEDMGGIDIKYGLYIPLVNAVRLLSIRFRIRSIGTKDRIAELKRGGHIDHELADEWMKAFDAALLLRSLTSYKQEEGYYRSSGILPGNLLTRERKKALKAAMRAAQKLHKHAVRDIRAFGVVER